MEKQYCTPVRSDFEYAEIPNVVTFNIDKESAREIMRLAALVRSNGLYKVAKFDYRAHYLQHDPVESPEEAQEAGHDNEVFTDADCLNVSDEFFWFTGTIKHCDVELISERKPVAELAEFFGIDLGSGA